MAGDLFKDKKQNYAKFSSYPSFSSTKILNRKKQNLLHGVYLHSFLSFIFHVDIYYKKLIAKKQCPRKTWNFSNDPVVFLLIYKVLVFQPESDTATQSKNKQVAQRATIPHLSPMCQGQISFQKIQTHPSFNACSCYMKVSKGSNQKQQRKSGNTIFPIISLWGYFLDAQGHLTP